MNLQRISHYLIISKIGAGGMGEVYLAEDVRLGRKVALKVLPAQLTDDEDRVLRFKQEARAASALNHPNILTVYDIGETGTSHFIATEFVEGETLRQRLASGELEIRESLDIAIQVAGALVAAHEASIIHRDLKPENIMIRPDGYAKVLDFGLAKLAEPRTPAVESSTVIAPLVSTEPGLIMGTPQYMSPEQVRGLDVDARSDIFSLGVVIYEMISGRCPFSRATVSDVIAAILQVDPPPLMHGALAAPVELRHIVSKSLQKERENRYRDSADLLSALKRSLQRLADENFSTLPLPGKGETLPAAAAVADSQSFLSRLRRNKAAIIVTATALLFIVAVATLLLLKLLKSSDNLPPAEPRVTAQDARQYLYIQLSESEQTAFVEQQARRVTVLLGETPAPLNNKAIRAIKKFVDGYAERVQLNAPPGSGEVFHGEVFHEDLRLVYGRASLYAPFIVRSFIKLGVPSILGIYLPMIESEYHDCLTGTNGAKGIFQFIPESARAYGLRPEDRCDIEKVAPAAARYIRDRVTIFGSDSTSMTLVILSFNRSASSIARDFQKPLNRHNDERSFWTLMDNSEKLDKEFQTEAINFVPKFFAAAIVGENPQSFGLQIQPLSSY